MPFTLGSLIGTGEFGSVFDLPDHPDRVIKVAKGSLNSHHQKTLQLIIDIQPSAYVRVHEFGIWDDNHFFYVMDKLDKISDDESKAIHTLFSHEDRNLKKSLDLSHVFGIARDLTRGLDIDIPSLMLFTEAVRASQRFLIHQDIHSRNIMKQLIPNTTQYHFKLVDLDHLSLSTTNHGAVK